MTGYLQSSFAMVILSPNKFPAGLKYRVRVQVYEFERECLLYKDGTVDVMSDHIESFQGRGDITACHTGQNCVSLLKCTFFSHL